MKFLSKEELELLKTTYPRGCRIHCDSMDGEPFMGATNGTLKYIDDAGQLHVAWDNGSNLALIPGTDVFWRLGDED